MNIDLEVFHYKVISHLNNAPFIVDWGALGLQNDPEAFQKEHTNWSFNYDPVDNGHNVRIESNINIPCAPVHNNPALAGTFYRYGGQTIYFVAEDEITPEIIGELTLVHLSRFLMIIATDTMNKSHGQCIHSVNIYCLATLIVTASTQF